MIQNILRFKHMIIEEKINDKRGQRQIKISYIKQIISNMRLTNYTELKK